MTDELIQQYTENHDEDRRLSQGIGPFEYERTIALIGRYLGPSKSTVVDVGGGTGAYALWLAGQGHVVHVVDLVPRHVEHVKNRASERSLVLGSAQVGDARSLPFDDEFADLVLLMGPLYHLTAQEDRLLALRESARITKPDGRIFCAAISRFASILAGFRFKRLDDPEFEAMVDQDLADGQHRNPVKGSQHLTTAYLHKPSDLRDEIERAGLKCERIIGVESTLGLLPELETWIAEKGRMYHLARKYADLVEEEENLLGASFHLMAVGRRP